MIRIYKGVVIYNTITGNNIITNSIQTDNINNIFNIDTDTITSNQITNANNITTDDLISNNEITSKKLTIIDNNKSTIIDKDNIETDSIKVNKIYNNNNDLLINSNININNNDNNNYMNLDIINMVSTINKEFIINNENDKYILKLSTIGSNRVTVKDLLSTYIYSAQYSSTTQTLNLNSGSSNLIGFNKYRSGTTYDRSFSLNTDSGLLTYEIAPLSISDTVGDYTTYIQKDQIMTDKVKTNNIISNQVSNILSFITNDDIKNFDFDISNGDIFTNKTITINNIGQNYTTEINNAKVKSHEIEADILIINNNFNVGSVNDNANINVYGNISADDITCNHINCNKITNNEINCTLINCPKILTTTSGSVGTRKLNFLEKNNNKISLESSDSENFYLKNTSNLYISSNFSKPLSRIYIDDIYIKNNKLSIDDNLLVECNTFDIKSNEIIFKSDSISGQSQYNDLKITASFGVKPNDPDGPPDQVVVGLKLDITFTASGIPFHNTRWIDLGSDNII